MRRPWRLFTARGHVFLIVGLLVVIAAMVAGQRDVMRIGLLLLALPVIAAVLVARARLRLSCERSVEPPRVALGSPMRGRITLGQEGRLPAGILLLEDSVPAELGNRPRFVVDKADLSWRREIEYPMLGRVRGRFHTGPLMVRTTDPFGLVQLDRHFQATTEVMITPVVEILPAMRSAGGAGSAGEARPHRVGVTGQDDVLVREYQQGDDRRRIHWRSTARRGDLMVRREEQAWDPTASVLLDARVGAHAGRGMHSSLEWAVSAAASVAVHFLDDGFGVEIYEPDGSMHIAGHLGQHSTASSDLALSRLTDLRARPTTSIHYAIEAADVDKAGQLVVAIMGRMTPEDASSLLRLRRNRAQGLAMVIDIDTFSDEPTSERTRRQHELATEILIENQWRVVEVQRGHERRPGLVGPGPTGSGCLMRASDRFVLASTVAVLLISFTARPLTTDSSYLGLSWFVVLVLAAATVGLRRARLTAGFVFASQLALLAVLLFVVSSFAPSRGEPWYAHYVDLWQQGLQHMQTQAAPMDADAGVKIIFVSVIGVIFVLTDLLVSGLDRPAWGIAPPAAAFVVPALGLGIDTGIAPFACLSLGYLGILVADGLNRTGRWTRGLSRDSADGFGTATPMVWRAAGLIGVPALVADRRAGGGPADAGAAGSGHRQRRRRGWSAAADGPDAGSAPQPQPGRRHRGPPLHHRQAGWPLPADGLTPPVRRQRLAQRADAVGVGDPAAADPRDER